MPQVVVLDLIWDRRSGPHQRHLSSQNVPELGNLIQARPTQEFPNGSYSRVTSKLEYVLALLIRVPDRRPTYKGLNIVLMRA
jgi:hypothetical protein